MVSLGIDGENRRETREIAASILLLAWPTMLEEALRTVVQYVDAAMVGRLGADATAVVGVVNIVSWLINSPMNAAGVGMIAYISRAAGAGETRQVKRASVQAVLIASALGLMECAVTLGVSRAMPRWMGMEKRLWRDATLYFAIVCAPMLFRAYLAVFGAVLRAVKDTRTPMLVNVFVNALNIVLNFLLIYESRTVRIGGAVFRLWGAGLGTTGAAIATAAAFMAGGCLMCVVLWRHPQVSPRGLPWRPDGRILRPCARIALPVAMERMVSCLGHVVFTSIVTALGTVSIAAHSIAETAEQAFYIPGYGMQSAATTLEGNALGEGDGRKLRKTARVLLAMVVVMMSVSGAVMYASAHGLMTMFSTDEQVIALGTTVLRICALSEPVFGAYIILGGIFEGVGDTLPPFLYSTVGMWGIRMPLSWLCVHVWGLNLTAVWLCMIGHNVAMAGMMAVHYWRGRWNPLRRSAGKNP